VHRLAIVTSHVIQYQDPLFKRLAVRPDIDLTVIFCSRHGAEPYRDEDMKTTLRWDLDLLAGYRHLFLRNLSTFDFRRGFVRLLNPSIVTALRAGRYDVVFFMLGWGSLTAWLGFLTCIVRRIPFAIYGDSSFVPEATSWRLRLRAAALRWLFSRTAAFATSGVMNAQYYQHYGADPRRFFLVPWAADNERFERESRLTGGERAEIRQTYAIDPGKVVIVFSGKLIPRKDPMTLLRAFEVMQHRDRAALLFMGDGELREALSAYTAQQAIPGVNIAGFVNQTEIPRVYGMSDIFVLPSLDDPRGTVVNEAMASGLPVVVTDRCGAVGDIVSDGENGFVFSPGDVAGLADRLDRLVADATLRTRMAARSRTIIATWDYERDVDGIVNLLHSLPGR
jgi:glycosyltransferase involved in cell wall biosynthesis